MPKPEPKPIDPGQLGDLTRALIDAAVDGNQPRLRPVAPVRTGGFTVYAANLRQYHKTVELAANAARTVSRITPHCVRCTREWAMSARGLLAVICRPGSESNASELSPPPP